MTSEDTPWLLLGVAVSISEPSFFLSTQQRPFCIYKSCFCMGWEVFEFLFHEGNASKRFSSSPFTSGVGQANQKPQNRRTGSRGFSMPPGGSDYPDSPTLLVRLIEGPSFTRVGRFSRLFSLECQVCHSDVSPRLGMVCVYEFRYVR